MLNKKLKSGLISVAIALLAIFAVIETALLLRYSDIALLKAASYNMSAMIAPCGIAYLILTKYFDALKLKSYQHIIALPFSIFLSSSILFFYSILTGDTLFAIEIKSLPLYTSSIIGVLVSLILIKITKIVYNSLRNKHDKKTNNAF